MTSARDLSARLADLLRNERHALADFLLALARFDADRLWLELGYASLFHFLHRELGLSKGAAHYRKTAAELVRRFPEIVEPIRDGRLCITSIIELAKVLTPENRAEVLPRFFHRSRREAKEVTAELRPDPAPPARFVVTQLRVTPGEDADDAGAGGALVVRVQPVEPLDANSVGPVGAPPAPGATRQAAFDVQPLTATLSRAHVTVSRRFLEKLAAARDALSHAKPGASEEQILEAGLDLLLAQAAKRRGLVEKPRKTPPPSRSDDHVPAHVRRAVWERDGGRCQFPVASGGVCGSTYRVELDHIIPRAQGGRSTVENMRCACDIHNARAAREVFGDAVMDRYTTKGRVRSG